VIPDQHFARATAVAQDVVMAADAPEPLVATLTDRQLHKPGEEPSADS
jgi:hypothetical protein